MEEFIKSFGTLILAIYGIVQIWLIALWKKYARKGEIDIYETGTIEIGYSTWGPTICLNGTLRGLNKDVFLKSIDLRIVRKKDQAQHNFRWIAFRSPKIDLAGTQPSSMEIPSGFLISPNSPHRYNIVFNDNDLFQDFRPIFSDYITEWNKVVEQLATKPLDPNSPFYTQTVKEHYVIIENFRNSKKHVDTYTALDRKCYWDDGEYSLILNVRTSKPDKIFSNNYCFSITETDSRNLKLNVITILEEPIANYLRIQNYPYNFAYSIYK